MYSACSECEPIKVPHIYADAWSYKNALEFAHITGAKQCTDVTCTHGNPYREHTYADALSHKYDGVADVITNGTTDRKGA